MTIPLKPLLDIVAKLDDPMHQDLYYPVEQKKLMDGIVSDKDLRVINTPDGNIIRTYYELAVLGRLRKEIKCKNIWVRNSLKYSDPEKDLPSDFYQRKEYYYKFLNLDKNGSTEIAKVRKELLNATKKLNQTIGLNANVRIGIKRGKPRIFITPHAAQEEPQNLTIVKQKVAKRWGNLSLLDMLKESDIRIGLVTEIINLTDKSSISSEVLRQRLLLCIYSLATNTDFKRICSGTEGVTEQDLRMSRSVT